MRKWASIPYIIHPLRVGEMAYTWSGDANLCIAGYCHDIVEDTTDGTSAGFQAVVEEIEKRFGRDVLNLVLDTTKDMSLPKKEREKEYLERFHKEASNRGILVKLIDRYDNVDSIDDLVPIAWIQSYIANTEGLLAAVPSRAKAWDKVEGLITLIRQQLVGLHATYEIA